GNTPLLRIRRQYMGSLRNGLEAEILEDRKPATESDGIALMVETRMEKLRPVAGETDKLHPDALARQRVDLLDILERGFRIARIAIAGWEGANPAGNALAVGAL